MVAVPLPWFAWMAECILPRCRRMCLRRIQLQSAGMNWRALLRLPMWTLATCPTFTRSQSALAVLRRICAQDIGSGYLPRSRISLSTYHHRLRWRPCMSPTTSSHFSEFRYLPFLACCLCLFCCRRREGVTHLLSCAQVQHKPMLGRFTITQ